MFCTSQRLSIEKGLLCYMTHHETLISTMDIILHTLKSHYLAGTHLRVAERNLRQRYEINPHVLVIIAFAFAIEQTLSVMFISVPKAAFQGKSPIPHAHRVLMD